MIVENKGPAVPTREDRKLRREERMRKRKQEELEAKKKTGETSEDSGSSKDAAKEHGYNIVGKDIDLQGFIQALYEASPIIERVFDLHGEVSIEDQKTKEDLVSLVKVQEKLSFKIAEFAGLNEKIINHRLIIRRVMSLISQLIQLYKLDVNSEKEVNHFEEKILESFKVLIEGRESTKEVFSDILSTDRILNIKLGLFEATCNLNDVSSIFKFDQTETDIYNHFLNTTTEMSRDLAFNWSKRANIEDKETLFELSIPKCGDLYIQAWLNNAIEILGGNNETISQDDFWRHFPIFSVTLKEMDMGYADHDEFNFEWLEERIVKNILNRVEGLKICDLAVMPGQVQILKNAVIRAYAALASTAWNEAANNYVAKCEAMSDEEIEKWAANEGMKPMDINLYFEELDNQIKNWKGIGEGKSLDFDKIKTSARKRLSFLWGISDAICKIKK